MSDAVVAVNLLGIVEHPRLTPFAPYRVDRDGRPYVPVGDGGVVLGIALGDSVFGTDTDHAAPGVTLTHPDTAARHALTAYSCVGNDVVVRTGPAAGASGAVLGKRGEAGQVIVWFTDDVLGLIRPGDQMSVRGYGQGHELAQRHLGVQVLNLDPRLIGALPLTMTGDGVHAEVAATLPSAVCGNGIGRPAQLWDVDLAVEPGDELRLGDLVAIRDLDARLNMGLRAGWMSVGIICHGSSPMPGHGPGLVPVITGPAAVLTVSTARSAQPALTDDLLLARPPATTTPPGQP